MYMELFVFISVMASAIALACILIYIRHCAKTQKKVDPMWIWIIGIALAVMVFLLWNNKSCINAKTPTATLAIPSPKPAAFDNAKSFDLAVKKTCIAQSYLNGVNPRANIEDSMRLNKSQFLALVPDNMDSYQITALYLAYDKTGKAEFTKQMMLHSLSDWEIGNVGSIFYNMVESLPSSQREENLKYFWILFQLYMGNITWDDVWDFPIKSYLNLDIDDIYINNYPTWNDGFTDILYEGDNASVHEMLY